MKSVPDTFFHTLIIVSTFHSLLNFGSFFSIPLKGDFGLPTATRLTEKYSFRGIEKEASKKKVKNKYPRKAWEKGNQFEGHKQFSSDEATPTKTTICYHLTLCGVLPISITKIVFFFTRKRKFCKILMVPQALREPFICPFWAPLINAFYFFRHVQVVSQVVATLAETERAHCSRS